MSDLVICEVKEYYVYDSGLPVLTYFGQASLKNIKLKLRLKYTWWYFIHFMLHSGIRCIQNTCNIYRDYFTLGGDTVSILTNTYFSFKYKVDN